MKKIGIFAGTFDPVHNGHLAFAEAALKQGLTKVMFLPEPRPRRKQGVRALEHRVAMVQLAVKTNPRFSTIVLEQARFTPHETLPLLQARFPGHKLVLLFGADVIHHMAGWPHADVLTDTTELMIASRRANETTLRDTIQTLEQTRDLRFNSQIIHPEQPEIASSVIRRELRSKQSQVAIPKAVEDYIKRHRLYVSASGSS